jgi:YbbR domain-containing protein
VDIKLNANIEYAPGYDIRGEFILNLDSIKIVGAKERIDTINNLTTMELNLSNVNNYINENIGFEALKDVEVFPKSLNVQADVQRFTEGTIEVPISITNKPEDVTINYFPKAVIISYYVDLERYNTISVNDFIVECSFNQIDEHQTFFVPEITKSPDFIKRMSIKQKRVDFIKL